MVKGINIDAVLDALDSDFTGFIKKEQIKVFYETYFDRPVDLQSIEFAILSVCGVNSSGKCAREKFIDVITEIDKKKSFEEQLRWDFRSLDKDGNWLITIQDAYLLLQSYCGNAFNLTSWRNFIHARSFPETKISYEEIKAFITSVPTGKPNTEVDIEKEGVALAQVALNSELAFFRELKTFEVCLLYFDPRFLREIYNSTTSITLSGE